MSSAGGRMVARLAVLLCVLAVPGAVAQSTGFREMQPSTNLTADTVVVNRNGVGQYGGKGALVCHEFGDRYFKPLAKLTIKVDGRPLLITNATSSLADLMGPGVAVDVYEHSLFACMQVSIPAGIKFPAKGVLSVSGTFGAGPDLESKGFKPNQVFEVRTKYDVVGRQGPQSLVVSMGSPLESGVDSFVGYHRDDPSPYVVSEPAAKLSLTPDPAMGDVIQNQTLLYKLELVVPSMAAVDTPVKPQVKDVTDTSFRIYVSKKFDTKVIARWYVSFSGPGSEFFSAPVKVLPGNEVLLDGLTPKSVYQINACAQFEVQEYDQQCFQITGFTKPTSGIEYVPSGELKVFPLESGDGMDLMLPERACESCPRFTMGTMSLKSVVDGTELFTKTYHEGGVYREVGFSLRSGYDLNFVYQTIEGPGQFQDGFRPAPVSAPHIPSGGAGVGEPEIMRVSRTSLVLRLPDQLNGSSSLIESSQLILTDAATSVVLLNSTFRGRGKDFRVDHISSNGAWGSMLTVTDSEGQNRPYVTAFSAVTADSSARMTGSVQCLVRPNGNIEVDVPLQFSNTSADVDSVSAVVVDPYGIETSEFSKTSVDGPGKVELVDIPKGKSVLIKVETVDKSKLKRTFDTLLTKSQETVPMVPDVGTPVVVAHTPTSITVNVPARTSAKERMVVTEVTVTVMDMALGKTIGEVSQDGPGTVVVDLKGTPGRIVQVVTRIKSGDDARPVEFRSVSRPTGLPRYDSDDKVQVFFQNLPGNLTQRIIVRLPLRLPNDPSQTDSRALISVYDSWQTSKSVAVKTAKPGPDVVFEGFNATNHLFVLVQRGNKVERFERPVPGSVLPYMQKTDFGEVRVDHYLVQQLPSSPPAVLPARTMFDGVVVIPALDGIVARVTHLPSKLLVATAKIRVTTSMPYREGLCIGSHIATYHVPKESDTYIPLPVGMDVDVCFELDTSRGDIPVNYHLPATYVGGTPEILAGAVSRVYEGLPGELVVRCPFNAPMQVDGRGMSKVMPVTACEVKVFHRSSRTLIKKMVFDTPGDFVVSGIPTMGAFDVELLPSFDAQWKCNQTMSMITNDPEVEAFDPPIPAHGMPTMHYDHAHGLVKLLVPKRVTASMAAAACNYTVRLVGVRAQVASGTIEPGQSTVVTLPAAPLSGPVQVVQVGFDVRDGKSHVHTYTIGAHRVGTMGFPPMPPFGEPSLLATTQGRLVLRVPPRLDDAVARILKSNTTMAFCNATNTGVWSTITRGGGDVEVPSELVRTTMCYSMTSNITLVDGREKTHEFRFEMATAGLGPLPLTCIPRLIPRQDGVVVLRVCNFDASGEDISKWRTSWLLVGVSDTAGDEVMSQQYLLRGVDNVIQTPCSEQDCIFTIIYAWMQERTVKHTIVLKSPQITRYRLPSDPDAWAPSHNVLTYRLPVKQMAMINVTYANSGVEAANATQTEPGDYNITGLRGNTRYKVSIVSTLLGKTTRQTMLVHTGMAPGVSATDPGLRFLPGAFEMTIQVPATSNDLAIAKAVVTVSVPQEDDGNSSNTSVTTTDDDDADDQYDQDYDFDGPTPGSGQAGSNGTTASPVKVLKATTVNSPAPGEQIRITDLKDNTAYNVTVSLINIKGMTEVKWKLVYTQNVSYASTSSHTLGTKAVTGDGTTSSVKIAPIEPLPKVPVMSVWSHRVHKNLSVAGPVKLLYSGAPTTEPPLLDKLAPSARYVAKVSFIGKETRDDRCAYMSTDVPPAQARKRKKPSVIRVTASDVIIGLPRSRDIKSYQVYQAFFDSSGSETSRMLLYRGLGERSEASGNVFIVRAMPAATDLVFSVTPTLSTGKTGQPTTVTATTDSVFTPCMVGKPRQPFETSLLPGSMLPKTRKFDVMWNPVETNEGVDPSGFPVTSYDVQVKNTGYNNSLYKAKWKTVRTDVPPNKCSFTHQGLIPGYTYVVRVIARNVFGPSVPGLETLYRIPSEVPNKAQKPSVAPTTKSAEVTWTHPYHNGEPLTGYRLECSPPHSQPATVYPSALAKQNSTFATSYSGAVKLSHTVAGLAPATKYQCRAVAINSVGEAKPSEPVSFSTYTDVPEPLINLRSTQIGRYHVELTWDKPRHNGLPLLSYDVQMRKEEGGDGETFVLLEECDDVEDLVCFVGRLLPGTKYSFRATSRNCAGTSAWSQPLTIRSVIAPPNPVTNLRMVASTDDSLSMAWDTSRINGAALTEHEVLCDDGKTCVTGTWTYPQEVPCVNYGPIKFKSQASVNDTDLEKSKMYRSKWRVAASNQPVGVITGLRPATTYRCMAYSHNQAGRSNNSAIVFVRTDDRRPDAVTSLRVESEFYSKDPNTVRLLLKWDKAIPNGQTVLRTQVMRLTHERLHSSTGLPLQLVPNGIVDRFVAVQDCAPECMYFAQDDARTDTRYVFRVRTVNSLGASDWTKVEYKTVAGRPRPMLIPRLVEKSSTTLTVTCVPDDDGGAELNYFAVRIAQGVVSGGNYSEDDDMGQFGQFSVASEWAAANAAPGAGDGRTGIVLPNLEQGTDYAVQCGTANEVGPADNSPSGVFATDAAPPDTPDTPTLVTKSPFDISLGLTFPDDNGNRLTECTLWVGGAWEWCGNMAGHTCDERDLFVPNFEDQPDGSMGPPRENIKEKLISQLVFNTDANGYDPITFSSTTISMPDAPCIECSAESSISDNPNDRYSYSKFQPGTMYCFKIKCTNNIGVGGYSNPACFKTDTLPPRQPKNARGLSKTKISATLQLPAPFGYGYQMSEMSTQITCKEGNCAGGGYNQCDNLDDDMICQDSPPLEQPVIRCSTQCSEIVGEFDCDSCLIEGLNPGTTYSTMFKGRSVAGWGPMSNWSDFSTDPAEPLPVQDVAISVGSSGGMDVNWEPPVYDQGSDILSYEMYVVCDNNMVQPSGIIVCEDLVPIKVGATTVSKTIGVVNPEVQGDWMRGAATAAVDCAAHAGTTVTSDGSTRTTSQFKGCYSNPESDDGYVYVSCFSHTSRKTMQYRAYQDASASDSIFDTCRILAANSGSTNFAIEYKSSQSQNFEFPLVQNLNGPYFDLNKGSDLGVSNPVQLGASVRIRMKLVTGATAVASANAGAAQGLLFLGGGGDKCGGHLYMSINSANKLQFGKQCAAAAGDFSESATVIEPDNEYDLMFIYDGTAASIYINGKLDVREAKTWTFSTSVTQLVIGAGDHDTPHEEFNPSSGTINNVIIDSRPDPLMRGFYTCAFGSEDASVSGDYTTDGKLADTQCGMEKDSAGHHLGGGTDAMAVYATVVETTSTHDECMDEAQAIGSVFMMLRNPGSVAAANKAKCSVVGFNTSSTALSTDDSLCRDEANSEGRPLGASNAVAVYEVKEEPIPVMPQYVCPSKKPICSGFVNSQPGVTGQYGTCIGTGSLSPGRHYKVSVVATNQHGKSSAVANGAYAFHSVPAAAPMALSAPKLDAAHSNRIDFVLSSPAEMSGSAKILKYELQCAKSGTTSWLSSPTDPSTDIHDIMTGIVQPGPSGAADTSVSMPDTYWCNGMTQADCPKTHFWCRYRATGKEGTCSNFLGCGPSEWSKMSQAWSFRTPCPDNGITVCSGHGSCDSTMGTCGCNAGWGSDACDVQVDTATCTEKDNGLVSLWRDVSPALQGMSYKHGPSAGLAEEGEFLLYKSTFHPSEEIHVTRAETTSATSAGIIAAAFSFRGHTITIESNPASTGCDTIRHNCINQMKDTQVSALKVLQSGSDSLKVERTGTATAECGGETVKVTNDFTGTVLTCTHEEPDAVDVAFGSSSLPGSGCSYTGPGTGVPLSLVAPPSGGHCYQNVINGQSGNSNSWIPDASNPYDGKHFVGIRLGKKSTVRGLDLSRDRTGAYSDRLGSREIQVTTVADPGYDTPSNAWMTVTTVTATAGTQVVTFTTPQVQVTGVRILVTSSGCIDVINLDATPTATTQSTTVNTADVDDPVPFVQCSVTTERPVVDANYWPGTGSHDLECGYPSNSQCPASPKWVKDTGDGTQLPVLCCKDASSQPSGEPGWTTNGFGWAQLGNYPGNTVYTVSHWASECQNVPSTATMIKLVMGNVEDYFKPTSGNNFCDMLTSHNKHQWSSDGVNWQTLNSYGHHLGGSSGGSSDGRSYVTFWGGSGGGGCCYTDIGGTSDWHRSFQMYYDTPQSSSSPCSDIWAGSSLTGNGNDCQTAETYEDAVAICTARSARLCSSLEMQNGCARMDTQCNAYKTRTWTSTDTRAATYSNEDGLCGEQGQTIAESDLTDQAVPEFVEGSATSLFTNPFSDPLTTCKAYHDDLNSASTGCPAACAAKPCSGCLLPPNSLGDRVCSTDSAVLAACEQLPHMGTDCSNCPASLLEISSSLSPVESQSARGFAQPPSLPAHRARMTVPDPHVHNGKRAVKAVPLNQDQHHVAKPGEIDASLRPDHHHPLSAPVLSSAVETELAVPEQSATPALLPSESVPNARLDLSRALPNLLSTHHHRASSSTHSSSSYIRTQDRVVPQRSLVGRDSDHIMDEWHHHLPASSIVDPSLGARHRPHHAVALALLSQSSSSAPPGTPTQSANSTDNGTNATMQDPYEDVECSPGISKPVCKQAHATCKDFGSCKLSCVQDVISTGDVNASLTKARRCQARMDTIAKEQEQAALDASGTDEDELPADPSATFVMCPSRVVGDEPWNVDPYDADIPSWTVEKVMKVVKEIEQGPVVNETNTTNITTANDMNTTTDDNATNTSMLAGSLKRSLIETKQRPSGGRRRDRLIQATMEAAISHQY